MESRDWLTVAAIVFAPFFAVQIQKWIERFREKRGRKLRIFQTLMSTRMARLSSYHVEALNMIDSEFYYSGWLRFTRKRRREKAVVDAWKSYLDQLNSLGEKPNEAQLQSWVARNDELFIDLLFEMSKAVGYDFDKVHLKRSIYSPRAHGEEMLDQQTIRENLAAILSGDKSIPMRLIVPQDMVDKQQALQESIKEYLDGKRAVKVRVENSFRKRKP